MSRLSRFSLPSGPWAAWAALLVVLPALPCAADVVQWNPPEPKTKASRLHTSGPTDPDTVWIGHVLTPTGLPGTPGGYGPHHIGRGPNRPGTGPGTSPNGIWTFDALQAGETDSLQGWWPVICPMASTGTSSFPDRNRPFFGFDYGNQGNYVGNQGPTAGRRTFGVTGYWHRDPGNNVPGLPDTGAVIPGPDVEWAPLGGGFSAWCGLRAHGDLTARDDPALGGTGNYFSQAVLDFNGNNNGNQIGSTSTTGTDKNFPGYGSQWDQMLYRDVVLADNASLSLSFKYRTNMSTGLITLPPSRVGWFDKDPLKPVALSDGNFISSSDAALTNSAPIDSFMVYIGVPVEPVANQNNDFVASDGVFRDIYDPQRRWFSEVIAINRPYRELLSTFGVRPAQPFSTTLAGGPGSIVQQILDAQAGPGGAVRLVFRVKTNRGFDDEDSFASQFFSGTAGAAIVDDVVVNGWAASNGDFETAGAIDNSVGVPATQGWKSTGKPPGIYFHVHNASPGGGLHYDDPCGAITSPNRFCNLTGNVITPGDHDLGEKPGGLFGANDQDRQDWLASPTINLRSNAPGDYNGMGIDAEIADVSGDYHLLFDIYVNLFDFSSTGNGVRFGWQAYPAAQPNGGKCWGEERKTITFFSNGGLRGCFQFFAFEGGAKGSGLLMTSNPSGIPDSIRVYIEHLARCFTTTLAANECSPTDGPKAGLYFDNLSFALVDAASPPALQVIIWDLFNDAFPVNESVAPRTSAFDTTAAQVRTGFNSAQSNGTLFRHNIPGDSALVTANGANVRLDLVFRILPGVGNYVSIGNRASALRRVPTSTTAATGNAGSSNFWESYLADAGAFGTGGTGVTGTPHDPDGPGPILPGTRWNSNHWNSARMDTAEINFFPCVVVNGNLGQLTPGKYATQYHESDPKFATLGIVKNRCFVVVPNPNVPGASAAQNTTCGNPPYPPPWTADAGSGFNPNEISGMPGKTREYTKIIPDGQLTPGAHVQYFFRKSVIGQVAFDMGPDTNFIFPQPAEDNLDGHRWQQFGVLPDRWKDQAFGGLGMACMLVVDLGDRRADELVWVSVADSIGLTPSARRGAHNGWKARGGDDITANVGLNDDMSVRAHGGQPGGVWDLYQVKGGESNVPAGRLGSRAASQVNPGLAAGKFSKHGPTGDMMRSYYRALVLLAADLGLGSIGPIPDQTDNDIGAFQDFLSNATPTGTTPRLFLAVGRDLVEGQTDPVEGHPSFFPTFFGADLRSPDYRMFSGNVNDAADLTPIPPINNTGAVYGVFNPCFFSNDVLALNTAVSGVQAGSFYQNVGGSGPYVSSVYVPDGAGRIARTLVEGFRFLDVGSRHLLYTGGLRMHYLNLFSNLYATLNCGALGAPVAVGDDPSGGAGSGYIQFLSLRSGNPMRSGEARIVFGIARTEKVEVRVYDVTGRLVRTVASRMFEAGREHAVVWDGRDDQGERVRSGVYFYRLRTPSWESQKKLTVLTR